MRRISAKRAASLPDESAFREELFARAGFVCDWCKDEPAEQKHEISRGASRDAARMNWCATLALGVKCHLTIHRLAGDDAVMAGLAILLARRPESFDLESFYRLTKRRWPERRDIELWRMRLNLERS